MENITHKQFTIEAYPNNEFRVAKISPVEMLAISTQIDFEDFKMTSTLIKFCLENVEVKQGEKWFPVKKKDDEFYTPMGIDSNLKALNEIFAYMMNEVISKVFQ